jgi:hypothetical protein
MSEHVDTARMLDAFLAPETDRLPDRVIDAALADIARTSQRRAQRVRWRFPQMPAPLRAAGLAVALLAVVGTGLFYLRGLGTGGPPFAPAATAPPRTPMPTLVLDDGLIDVGDWMTYTSERYGYKIQHPPDWTVIPGDHDWTLDEPTDTFSSTAPDRFETQGAADGLGIRLSVWSVTVASGTALEDWIEAYCESANLGSCVGIADHMFGVETYFGEPALLWQQDAHDTQAFAIQRLREYDAIFVAAIWRTEDDPAVRPWGGARRLLATFVSQMIPQGGPTGSPTPS